MTGCLRNNFLVTSILGLDRNAFVGLAMVPTESVHAANKYRNRFSRNVLTDGILKENHENMETIKKKKLDNNNKFGT